jgi:hypothetical protein
MIELKFRSTAGVRSLSETTRSTKSPPVRKVRTAQGTVLDNVKAEQSDGKCNRKKPPRLPPREEWGESRE